MPTYEYLCDNCQHRFEQFQSMKDEPLKDCPQCHQAALKRLIGSGAGIIFKGSGFYCTDYRSDSYNQQKSADSASGKQGAEGKSDGSKNGNSSSDSSKSGSDGAGTGNKST